MAAPRLTTRSTGARQELRYLAVDALGIWHSKFQRVEHFFGCFETLFAVFLQCFDHHRHERLGVRGIMTPGRHDGRWRNQVRERFPRMTTFERVLPGREHV